jgi:hypothetical protein
MMFQAHQALRIVFLSGLALLCSWTQMVSLHAQYGFGTFDSPAIGYGSEWSNSYSGAMMQVPQWIGGPSVMQPIAPTWQNWQLGAYLVNTNNGVLVEQVVPGGIAAMSGLKSGDIVVSVGGFQVGYVNGRAVDLIYEINRRVDSYGRARLVVFDVLTRQLKSLDLAISQPTQSVSTVVGEVSFDRGVLASGYGTLKVELLNTSRPYMQVGGGSDYRQTFGNGPFAYTIRYDPRYINALDRYRLVATLYDANRQVVASGFQDIAAPALGTQVAYNLRLQGPALYAGNSVNTGAYYPPDMSMMYEAFRQYLGREPSLSESQVWSSQLATGSISKSEMKAQLLSSTAFYDRAGNNPDLFIQRMIETATGQQARYDQIQNWRVRLGFYGGMRLPVAREFLTSISQ